jgi:hypothetical protein
MPSVSGEPLNRILVSGPGLLVSDEVGHYEGLIIARRQKRINKMRKYGQGEM